MPPVDSRGLVRWNALVVTAQTGPIDIDRRDVGTLELEGFEVPYVDLEFGPAIRSRVSLDGTEYSYQRSFPIKGHSAVMPEAVRGLLTKGKQVLVIERSERYYVFAAE
jgi:hypothetical protein